MHRMQQIIEEQDVASLVLLLKELIPDYNPGSRMLKPAMLKPATLIQPNLAKPVKVQVASGQVELAG
jgi:hypothetical protein